MCYPVGPGVDATVAPVSKPAPVVDSGAPKEVVVPSTPVDPDSQKLALAARLRTPPAPESETLSHDLGNVILEEQLSHVPGYTALCGTPKPLATRLGDAFAKAEHRVQDAALLAALRVIPGVRALIG